MRRFTFLLPSACVAVSLMVGCTTPAPKPVETPAPTPVSPQQAADVQADLSRSMPGAVVGSVRGANNQEHQAAVHFDSTPDLKKGDSIQFLDSHGTGIANGQVYTVDKTNANYPVVVVDFEPMTPGRAPVAGDMAVFVPSH